jgi:pyrimidine-nucleoside phosphorylase/thymidine phosphorylase
MISGRGLGITGGTLDKLEAIPGYRTRLATKEFLEVVRRCGCAICGQTERLAPADRKLYALRDVTGTVPSVPLITASILSKKLSEGLQALVLDVKCGCGAFMTTPDQARALALSLLTVARGLGVRTAALITDMDTPLGRTAGNAVEVLETLRVLRGEGPADVAALTVALGAQMLLLAGVESSEPQAREKIERTLAAGQGYDKFVEMVRLQGGDTRALEDPARLPQPGAVAVLKAKQAGCVVAVDAGKIGRACLLLGAGRTKTSDGVDPAAGIAEMVKPGEWVAAGDRLATLQAASSRQTEAALPLAAAAYRIAPEAPAARPLIIEALLK